MSDHWEKRWKQRFENFAKAILLLREALDDRPVDDYSRLEQEGIIQRFEYTFELAWKTVKDRLRYEGFDEKTPRAVIRRAFAAGFITEAEAETWLDALDKRNRLSHTYDENTALAALHAIQESYYPLLEKIYRHLRTEAAG